MKLIVLIPAFNEEKTLPVVIKSVPRKIKGITSVKVLVYDDGSTDKTALNAKKAGANFVVSHKRNMGLARTFRDGVKEALRLGADIIVNTDADNQYDQAEIAKLVVPVLKGEADLVSGNRQVEGLDHMPTAKKYGNMVGSFMIRLLTGVKVVDASSGFRAFTRKLAEKIPIFSTHTYTHEMLIAAHFREFVIREVPVTFKKRTTGKSRLIAKGVFSHMSKSAATILRAVLLYRALAVFTFLGLFFSFIGTLGVFRFLYFALIMNKASGHIQSLIISSILIAIGFNTLAIGFLADMISYNRKLLEEK